ncbi:MAG: peptidylprolyl isomerase [Archangium sp.]|nr:peptidylprolyl isomerase [Archangium sp.]
MTRLLLSLALVSTTALAGEGKFTAAALKGKDLYATISTAHGDIVIRFFAKEAPKTVANFVGLAAGEKEFTDASGKPARRAYYDGLVFHRVIQDFMIQGGDPTGTGSGGPGYSFEDEFKSGRAFDKVGLLAMANRGPATNGSQFFITTSTPGHLNGKHTIFGEVISGYEIVVKISMSPGERVAMKTVTISEKPPKGVGK